MLLFKYCDTDTKLIYKCKNSAHTQAVIIFVLCQTVDICFDDTI